MHTARMRKVAQNSRRRGIGGDGAHHQPEALWIGGATALKEKESMALEKFAPPPSLVTLVGCSTNHHHLSLSGSGDGDKAKTLANVSLTISFGLGTLLMILFLCSQSVIPLIFTSLPEIIKMVAKCESKLYCTLNGNLTLRYMIFSP